MSSINPHYTFNYSQPEGYRFSHDSVFMARRVFELLRDNIRASWQILDLCSGTGIVGMDFLFHCQKELGFAPRVCDFLEIQSVYKEHFIENVSRLGLAQTEMSLLLQNYSQPTQKKYDLILCNPPFFRVDDGVLSPNLFKNRCRFFVDATAEELVAAIEHALAPHGQAFVLCRSPELFKSSKLQTDQVEQIRGTPLLRFEM